MHSFLQGLETIPPSEHHWCGCLVFRATLDKKFGVGGTAAASSGQSRLAWKWELREGTAKAHLRCWTGRREKQASSASPSAALWSISSEEEQRENRSPGGLGSELLQEQRQGRGPCRGCVIPFMPSFRMETFPEGKACQCQLRTLSHMSAPQGWQEVENSFQTLVVNRCSVSVWVWLWVFIFLLSHHHIPGRVRRGWILCYNPVQELIWTIPYRTKEHSAFLLSVSSWPLSQVQGHLPESRWCHPSLAPTVGLFGFFFQCFYQPPIPCPTCAPCSRLQVYLPLCSWLGQGTPEAFRFSLTV